MPSSVITENRHGGVQARDTSLGLVVLLPLLLIVHVATFAVLMGSLQVLVPSQIAAIDPANKVLLFGIVTGIAALVAAIANPVAGALSDRTRGRFGRRAPWLLGGALATGGALTIIGNAGSIAMIGVGLCLVQAAANCVLAAIVAVMPERVAMVSRGRASAVIALGIPLGSWVGTTLGSRFVSTPLVAYGAFAAIIISAVALFVLIARERPYDEATVRQEEMRENSGFFSALAHADFRWAFISRFLFLLGVFMVNNYLLYILQDHIRLAPGVSALDMLGRLITLSTIFVVLATLVGGWASDRIGRRKPFVIGGALLAGLAILAPVVSPDATGMIVLAVLLNLGFGCYLVVDAALITQVLPDPATAARDLGILNIASAGPQVAAPLAASAVVLWLGGYAALFACAGLLALASAVAITRVKQVR